MYPLRKFERGFNQSEIIAKAIIANDNERKLLYAPQWLEKIKDTQKQSRSESKEERLKNLKDCFRANPKVNNYYVFLIDDVTTTGSTLIEAKKTLMEAGAKDVFGFTIAH
jgi:competence protein ComFC